MQWSQNQQIMEFDDFHNALALYNQQLAKERKKFINFDDLKCIFNLEYQTPKKGEILKNQFRNFIFMILTSFR